MLASPHHLPLWLWTPSRTSSRKFTAGLQSSSSASCVHRQDLLQIFNQAVYTNTLSPTCQLNSYAPWGTLCTHTHTHRLHHQYSYPTWLSLIFTARSAFGNNRRTNDECNRVLLSLFFSLLWSVLCLPACLLVSCFMREAGLGLSKWLLHPRYFTFSWRLPWKFPLVSFCT